MSFHTSTCLLPSDCRLASDCLSAICSSKNMVSPKSSYILNSLSLSMCIYIYYIYIYPDYLMPYYPYIIVYHHIFMFHISYISYISMISMTIALFGCPNPPHFQLPGADGLTTRRPERSRVGVVGMRDLPIGKPLRCCCRWIFDSSDVLLFGEKTSDTKMEIAFEIRT